MQQKQCIYIEYQGQIAYVLTIAVIGQYILRRIPLQPAANFHYVAPVDKLIVAKQPADGGCGVRDTYVIAKCGRDMCQRYKQGCPLEHHRQPTDPGSPCSRYRSRYAMGSPRLRMAFCSRSTSSH